MNRRTLLGGGAGLLCVGAGLGLARPGDEGAPHHDERALEVGLDDVDRDAPDPESACDECVVAKPVGVLVLKVDGAVHLDDETGRRCEEVDDERAKNDLTTKANAKRATPQSLPKNGLGCRGLEPHLTRTRGQRVLGDRVKRTQKSSAHGSSVRRPRVGGRSVPAKDP